MSEGKDPKSGDLLAIVFKMILTEDRKHIYFVCPYFVTGFFRANFLKFHACSAY